MIDSEEVILLLAVWLLVIIQARWLLSVGVGAFAVLIQISYNFLLFLWDRLGSLALVFKGIFIDIRLLGQELRLDEVVYKVFKLQRSCRFRHVFIGNLVLILFNSLVAVTRSPIVLFWDFSLNSKGTVLLDSFGRMDLRLHFHLIGVNWRYAFWVGEVFRIKRGMMDDNFSRLGFGSYLCLLRRYLIGKQRLRSHFLWLRLVLWVLFGLLRMSIDVDTVYILLNGFNDIRIFFIIFVLLEFLLEQAVTLSQAFGTTYSCLVLLLKKTIWHLVYLPFFLESLADVLYLLVNLFYFTALLWVYFLKIAFGIFVAII